MVPRAPPEAPPAWGGARAPLPPPRGGVPALVSRAPPWPPPRGGGARPPCPPRVGGVPPCGGAAAKRRQAAALEAVAAALIFPVCLFLYLLLFPAFWRRCRLMLFNR